MKRLFVFVLLIILAGCGTGVPDVDGTDWCYKFDFRQDDQGFNIVEGSWQEGFGLLTDAEGDLVFNYDFGTFIEPKFVIVVVQRPAGVTGDIAVSAAGDVFGVSATFSAVLPAAISTYPVVAQPDTVGISGRSINVTAQSDQDLLLQSIEVRGMGGSPFGVNICDDSQPLTPSTDTPTPELTYTSTVTATSTVTRTPTISPTPTNTPDGEWCYFWNFDLSDGDWLAQPGRGVYVPGEGWGSESPPDNVLSIYYEFDTELDLSEAVINWSVAKDFSDYDRIAWDYHSNVPSDGSQSDTGIIARVEDFNLHTSGSTGLGAGTAVKSLLADGAFIGFAVTQQPRYRSVLIRGPGALPGFLSGGEECDPEPTPTPGSTPTPGTPTAAPTATAAGGWTCAFNFQNNNGGWVSAFNAQWGFDVDDVGAWRAATTTPNSLGIRYVSPGGVMPLTSIRVKGRTFGTRTDDEDELNFRTYYTTWSTYTQDSHNNTAFDETYSFTARRYTTRLEVFLSVTQTTVNPTRIDLIELRGVGGYNPCGGGTPTVTAVATLTPEGTGTGTLTPRPLVTGTAVPSTRTPIVFPTINIDATLVPGTPGTGTPPTAVTGTPSTAIPPDQIGDETGEIIGFGWQIGWGLFRTLFAWVGQVTDDMGALLDAFVNTPPQAIPGLPQCMTRPMEHDICAIYYIMDWTLFAPNTPGAFIIPVVLLIMNLYIFIKFVSWVLRLIRRGENTTHVQ